MRTITTTMKIIFIFFIIFHLTLVIFGATGNTPFKNIPSISKILFSYQSLTGSDNGFGFFAPSVGAEGRIISRNYDGKEWKIEELELQGMENKLRLSTLISQALNEKEEEVILAYLSTINFNKNEDVIATSLELQFYFLPKLRSEVDVTPKWTTAIVRTFIHPERINEKYAK